MNYGWNSIAPKIRRCFSSSSDKILLDIMIFNLSQLRHELTAAIISVNYIHGEIGSGVIAVVSICANLACMGCTLLSKLYLIADHRTFWRFDLVSERRRL